MKPIRALIWDVDGTLADTIDLCVTGLQKAIEAHGGPRYERSEIIERFGPTEEGLLRNELGDAWEDAIEIYLDAYSEGHREEDLAFPGIPEIVADLAAGGVPMAVVTGKGARSAVITLNAIELHDVFEPVVAGSMEGSVKGVEITRIVDAWALDPTEVAYIGDAPSDIRESRRAGVVAVAAAWKSDADASHLESLGPEVVVSDAAALRSWIARRVVRAPDGRV